MPPLPPPPDAVVLNEMTSTMSPAKQASSNTTLVPLVAVNSLVASFTPLT